MAACGSFQHMFDTSSLPETHNHQSSSLIDSLSSTSSSSPSQNSSLICSYSVTSTNSDGFRSTTYNRNNLQLCTEGLGFESLVDDMKDLKNDNTTTCCTTTTNQTISTNLHDSSIPTMDLKPVNSTPGSSTISNQYKISRNCGRTFPPPISCIGRTGISFKSYRQDGRFVLQEERIPSQEFLHASRQDGRLRLRFVQDDDETEELTDDVEEDEDGFEEECEENSGGEGKRSVVDMRSVGLSKEEDS